MRVCVLYCIGPSNEDYIEKGLLISIRSLQMTNPDIPIEIFYKGLSSKQLEQLSDFNLTNIEPTGFDEGMRKDLGDAMFLRLYAGILEQYDKVIYLDGDTLILDDILPLTKLSEFPVYVRKWGRLKHLETNWNEALFNKLGLLTSDHNINSGVMIIEPKFLKDSNFCDMAKKLGQEIGFDNLYNPDQLIIYLLGRQLNCLGTFDLIWNFMKYDDFDKVKFKSKINRLGILAPHLSERSEFVKIVHYNSDQKPWVTNTENVYNQFI